MLRIGTLGSSRISQPALIEPAASVPEASAAGKHVLCEKAVASNADEAAQVAEAASASGLVVMEAMHYRYHPLTQRLAEVVGELGPVRHIQAWTSFAITNPGDIRYDYS